MHLIFNLYPRIKPSKCSYNQFEIDLQGNIFFTPFQYISSTLSNLVHTGLHTQQSTFRSLAEGLFSAATPHVILVIHNIHVKLIIL